MNEIRCFRAIEGNSTHSAERKCMKKKDIARNEWGNVEEATAAIQRRPQIAIGRIGTDQSCVSHGSNCKKGAKADGIAIQSCDSAVHFIPPARPLHTAFEREKKHYISFCTYCTHFFAINFPYLYSAAHGYILFRRSPANPLAVRIS